MAIGDITGRLSVSLVGASDTRHTHKKYVATINNPISIIPLPDNEHFVASGASGLQSIIEDPLQVYVCGILQTNGVHFQEIVDTNVSTNGIGIDFMEDILQPGDVITMEWVVKI